MMRGVLRALIALYILIPLGAHAADEKLTINLNSVESSENRCRMNFVVENTGAAGLESLKLDLVVFDNDGAISRRLITEMGPIRPKKTIVRAFLIDTECKAISSILVNDVTACTPGNPPACLDALSLSSRVKEIRLYK
jgi:hypothetical protein